MELQMTIKGRKVVDATKPLVVTIQPRDISKGKDKRPEACAAAKAAVRGIPNCVEARVHLSRVYIKRRDRDVWERYNTGGALRSEIMAFDRGGRFEPGEYTLTPLAPSQRTGKKSGTETNRNRKSPSKRARKHLHVAQGVRHRMGTRGGN